MPLVRVLAVAAGVLAVLWIAFDPDLTGAPALPGQSAALAILALVFGSSAWAMQLSGRPERAPLLAGLSLGIGAYVVLKVVLPQ